MAHFGNKTEAAFVHASLREFIFCWQSRKKATLSLECSEGKASVNLSFNLGHPGEIHAKNKRNKSRKTPSRIKRDKARAIKFQNPVQSQSNPEPDNQNHYSQEILRDIEDHNSSLTADLVLNTQRDDGDDQDDDVEDEIYENEDEYGDEFENYDESEDNTDDDNEYENEDDDYEDNNDYEENLNEVESEEHGDEYDEDDDEESGQDNTEFNEMFSELLRKQLEQISKGMKDVENYVRSVDNSVRRVDNSVRRMETRTDKQERELVEMRRDLEKRLRNLRTTPSNIDRTRRPTPVPMREPVKKLYNSTVSTHVDERKKFKYASPGEGSAISSSRSQQPMQGSRHEACEAEAYLADALN